MKKRQSSPNVSPLLLVFITKRDGKEKEGGWKQLGVLKMNIVSHTQQPVSYKQGNQVVSYHMWKCGSVWIWWNTPDFHLICLVSATWILLQEVHVPLKPSLTATLIFDESCNSYSRIYWESGLCAHWRQACWREDGTICCKVEMTLALSKMEWNLVSVLQSWRQDKEEEWGGGKNPLISSSLPRKRRY